MSFIGLFLIALGTGGIKPCVAPFGAEQFKLPEQESELKNYFSWFYASVNAGSMISSVLTPYLRNTQCLNQENCFSLAFGVPAAMMTLALGNKPGLGLYGYTPNAVICRLCFGQVYLALISLNTLYQPVKYTRLPLFGKVLTS